MVEGREGDEEAEKRMGEVMLRKGGDEEVTIWCCYGYHAARMMSSGRVWILPPNSTRFTD